MSDISIHYSPAYREDGYLCRRAGYCDWPDEATGANPAPGVYTCARCGSTKTVLPAKRTAAAIAAGWTAKAARLRADDSKYARGLARVYDECAKQLMTDLHTGELP